MTLKNLLCAAFTVAFSLIPAGCGYHVGSIMHPQIRSIAIAPIRNETIEPFASAALRQALSEQFQHDNSLKVKSMEEADCILFAKISEISTKSTQWDSGDDDRTFRPGEFSLSVEVEFRVVIPGKAKPLISNREISGSADYQVLIDHHINRRRGIQQACRNAAEQAVIYTVEAW